MSDGWDAVLRGCHIEHARVAVYVRSLGRTRGTAVRPQGRCVQENRRPRARSEQTVGIECARCEVCAKGVGAQKAQVERF
jgi:hypothetical protein